MFRRSFVLAGLSALGAMAATGIGRAADGGDATPAGNPTGAALITIDNFSFSPPQLTVAAGTRVTWTNRDDIPHTVVDRDDPRAMKSPPLDTDESFSFTFSEPGTYHYFCSLHSHMQGVVIVQ